MKNLAWLIEYLFLFNVDLAHALDKDNYDKPMLTVYVASFLMFRCVVVTAHTLNIRDRTCHTLNMAGNGVVFKPQRMRITWLREFTFNEMKTWQRCPGAAGENRETRDEKMVGHLFEITLFDLCIQHKPISFLLKVNRLSLAM